MTDHEITLALRYLEDESTAFSPREREVLYRLAGDPCKVSNDRFGCMIPTTHCKPELIAKLPAHIRVALKLTA